MGCQPGDSGGPAYQRAANNNVYATGTLVAGAGSSDCFYQAMQTILNDSNTSVVVP